MAGESISIPILTPGADAAARNIKQVGDAAAGTGAKLDFAAVSLKTFNDAAAKAAKADATSVNALKAHAKATALVDDAYRVLAGDATKTTKLFADQQKKMDDSAKSAGGLASRFAALAGTGGAAGGGMGALIGLGVALSPVIATLGTGLGGLALAALATGKNSKLLGQAVAPLKLQFAGFQKELQPVILTDFAKAAALAGHVLTDIQPVTVATGKALGGLISQVDAEFKSQTWQQFFGFMASQASPDMQLLGKDITDLLQIIPPLVQDMQPLAHGLLVVSDGATQAADSLVKFYDSFQHNVPVSNEHTINFLRDLDRWTVDLTNHIPGAQAVNNWLTSVQRTLTGTGTAAQQAAPEVRQAAQATSDLMKTTVTTVTPMDHLGKAASTTSFTVSEYGKNANLTVTPVDRLGRATEVTAAHIGGVVTAADLANIKIINVRHSVQDLTTALTKGLDPLLAYTGGLITQKDDAKNLATALQASHDKIGLNTAAQRNSFQYANTYIKDLESTAQNALASHQGIDKEITSLQNSLGPLEHAQSHSRLYWQEVRTLIGYLDKLRRERAIRESVTVFGSGTWSLSQPGGKLAGPTGTARGWMVSGGTPGKDSVPIMAMPGELVVPKQMVSSGAVDHLRGSIPGFAAGGIVPDYQGSVAGLPPWISHNQRASVTAVTDAIARSFAASFRSAALGAGGSPGFGIPPKGPLQSYAMALLRAYGWANQWNAFNSVVMRESGWNVFAQNPSSGAYGIPQALPGSKMASAGADWRTDGFTQLRWMMGYIKSVYGSPAGAWNSELTRGWYDNGGILKPGFTLAYNGTGRPEMVVPGGRSSIAGGQTVIVNVQVGHGTHPVAAAREIARLLNDGAKSGVKLRTSILGPG